MDLKTIIENFKDEKNRWRSGSLFIEKIQGQAIESGYNPLFTLREYDYEGKLSLKRLYMEAADITEYKFAMSVFGSYECWENLIECNWFRPHAMQWRKELTLKLKAEAIKEIKDATDRTSISKYQWLYETYGKEGTAPKRGRPSKSEVSGALKSAVEDARTYREDAERLGLTVVK